MMFPREVIAVLLQFKFQNYKSFSADTTLDMQVTTSIRERKETLIKSGKMNILPLAAIYGANASGKSNLLQALSDMRRNVLNLILKHNLVSTAQFAFDDELRTQPTTFEVFLKLDKKVYQYGFTANKTSYLQEWFYENRTDGSQVTLFQREGAKISVFGPVSFSRKANVLRDLVDDNALFLSFLGLRGVPYARNVFSWFMGLNFLSMGDYSEERFLLNPASPFWKLLFDDDEIRNRCVQLIREADPCILDMRIVKEEDADQNPVYFAYTKHQSLDNKREYEVRFDIESDGTRKLLSLYPMVVSALKFGGILLVDELDAKLHALLFLRIVRLFHDKSSNTNNAQLVFTAHNPVILSKDYLRRDEIWFVEKDENGSSTLKSLVEYKDVRSDLDYLKNYLFGRFGAIPFTMET